MTIRPLVIGPQQREDANRILEYSLKNPYYPGDSVAPGSIPQHVLIFPLEQYRAVFSITVMSGLKYRHLSISVPAAGAFPSPQAVVMIGELFGMSTKPLHFFTGLPVSWIVNANKQENCIIVAEVMP